MIETIAALSSGAPPSAIGVIRISGPAAFDAARRISGSLPAPREARLRRLRDNGVVLDDALVIAFPAPDTATGEDLVELHVHGGVAVVDAVLTALTRGDVRLAEPGEFTRRALENGRLDLTQVEGLAALLAAQTEAQRRAAVHAAGGALHHAVRAIEARSLSISARVELSLDFADETDSGSESAARASIDTDLRGLADDLHGWLAKPTAEPLLRGFRVVLAGPANSGKSTLLNRMAGRDAAIVSDIAGTTRDRIDVPVQHRGIAFVLSDTAGLNPDTLDPIEQAGIERTHRAVEEADVLLWLGDGPAPIERAILVHARSDLSERAAPVPGRVAVSGQTGAGIEDLWDAIHAHVAAAIPPLDERTLNARQHRELDAAREAIEAATVTGDPVLVGHLLAQARTALDRLTGRSDTEAMLDGLFGRFCIGK
jgi:tRNA modification GTPase